MRNSKMAFVRSLGYHASHEDDHLYSALMFQPRTVGAVTVIGVLLQAPWLFFALSAALGWSALVPTRSVFDAVYNAVAARLQGLPPLEAAPPPRRFAGGLAATLSLAIGVALAIEAQTPAWTLEAVQTVAVAAVVFGRSCAGANLYHALRQRLSEAG